MDKIIQLISETIRYEKDYKKAAQLVIEHQIRLEKLIEQTYKINFIELAQLIDEILKKDK
jgi:hypothetical protein